MNNNQHSFFAAVPKGMELLLQDELKSLGAENAKQTLAGVSFQGSLELAYRICLWSRLANRILMPLATFSATSPEELYREVGNISWFEHMEPDGTLAVDFNTSKSKINHSHYGALKVKDAIVDQFRDLYGVRPSVELETPDIRINLYLFRDQATLSLDLSGGSLHRRGYREAGVAAPLKENLAAAILLRAGWPEVAKQGGGLVDPMCGSGTLPIEAAMMAGDLAPGLMREHFGFLKWKKHQPEVWDRLIDEAEEREQKGLDNIPPIVGYDANPLAIKASLENLEKIGLRGYIHFEKQELATVVPHPKMKDQNGLFVINPPYGERLGELRELKPLYTNLGKRLRDHFSGWNASILTGNEDLGKCMGIRSRKQFTLYNGAIKCKLLNFQIQPEFFVQGEHKIFSSDDRPELSGRVRPEAEMFANRLKKNLKKLKNWRKKEEISCFRAYDRDLPEYAVAVDIYDKWVHVQEYAPPKTIDPEKAKERLNDVMEVIPTVLDVPYENVFLKVRKRQKGKEQYTKLDSEQKFYEVSEYGYRFRVNFSDYLDTGLFLDHRITRKIVGQMAAGKRFLNLFSYTGSATVYAAQGGAKSTTTVDSSKVYLGWARENLALNGFGYEKHRFVQADCLKWIKEETNRYDLIFLDPPTFSNSKRMESSFDIQQDHVELITNTMKLLNRGGVLIFSNNFRQFKMDFEALNDFKIEELSKSTLPKDFERNPKIHNSWKITENR